MNLLEVLLAGVLFFGSSTASLLIWSRAVAALDADARRGALLEGLEAELQAAESRLREAALSQAPGLPCQQRQRQLLAALDRDPAAGGVTRQLEGDASAAAVRLLLGAEGLERRRSYQAAAFGGCLEGLPPEAGSTAADPGSAPLPPRQEAHAAS